MRMDMDDLSRVISMEFCIAYINSCTVQLALCPPSVSEIVESLFIFGSVFVLWVDTLFVPVYACST